MFSIAVCAVIYISVMAYVIVDRTNVEWWDSEFTPHTKVRDVEPKDVWVSLVWPLLIIKFCIKILLGALHQLVTFILVAFGIGYNKTRMYYRIHKLLD